jgi:hypothetical protein
MGSYTDNLLRRLRNDIAIDLVIKHLRLETRKYSGIPFFGYN